MFAVSTFNECKSCRKYDWLDTHKCPPLWRVWIHEHDAVGDPEDGRVHGAADAETAAYEAVDRWDECERDVLRGEVRVLVKPEGEPDAAGEWFVVTAECVVEYSANPCDPPEQE